MKICKICNTENEDNNIYCKHCGAVLRFPPSLKWFLIGLIIWPALFYAFYLYFKESSYVRKIQKQNNIDFKELLKNYTNKTDDNINPDSTIFKSYCVNPDEHIHRKTDGNLQRGDTEIIFNKDMFTIKQNNEIVEYPIDSIYYFDIWEYKDDTYFKFRMNNLNEYKFKSVNFEADKIAKYLRKKDIKVEDNRD